MKSIFHIPTAALTAAVAVFSTLLTLCPIEANCAKQSKGNSYPDFAYPQTVIKNADVALRKAAEAGNWGKVADAAIQMVTADVLVNQDNAIRELNTIDSIAKTVPKNWKPAFLLIQADFLCTIYNSIRWEADRRVLPLDSIATNPFEWSRDVFADRVYSLCKEVIDCKELKNVKLKEWSSFLTDTADTKHDGITVRQFIDMQCFALLNTFCDETKDIIPFFSTSISPTTPTQKCTMLRNQAIDDLIIEAEHLNQPLILANALTDKTNCLAPSLRIKNLVNALDRVKDTEGTQLILVQLHQYVGNHDQYSDSNSSAYSHGEFVSMLRKSVKQFPKGKYANALKNIIAEMTLPTARINFKSQYLSSDSIAADVELSNCNKVFFLIYDYSPYAYSDNQPKTSTVAAKCRLVKAVKVATDGDIPFDGKVFAEIGALPPGVYTVIPSSTPDKKGIFATVKDDTWRDTFAVSDISVMSLQYPDGSSRVFVVDGSNGAPLEGASVEVYSQANYREKSRLVQTLTTDKDGAVTVTEKRFEIRASHNGSKWESKSKYYNYLQRKDTVTRPSVQILTDRTICRPGDSINAAVIAFNRKEDAFNLDSGKNYQICLLDANGKELETQSITTDSFGRASAEFRIPNHGLTGSWVLTVTDKDGKRLGTTGFRVEEYVAPSFFLTAELSENEVSPGDSVCISGQVLTYSGMPVADAEVKYHVEYITPMRWFNSSNASYDSSVATDSEGKYNIALPTANLKDTKFEHGIFTISLSAVSPAGETQTGPVQRFSIGREYYISLSEKETVAEASTDMYSFTVNVIDILGKKVTKQLNYSLTDVSTGKIAAEGSFFSPKLTLSISNLVSAKYRLDITLAEDSAVKTSSDFIVWRDTDTKAPAGTGLWIPRSIIKASPGSEKVKVTFGNGEGNRWIPVVESGNDSILSFRWVYVDKDNVTLEFNSPPTGRSYTLNFNSMSQLKSESATIEIKPSVSDRIELSTVTFRDKISAGDKEKWSFLFSKEDMPMAQMPALAVMTDASLNAIVPFKWNFAPNSGLQQSAFAMRMSPIRRHTQTTYLKRVKYLSFSDFFFPDINTYEQEWGIGTNMNVMEFAMAPAYARSSSSTLVYSAKKAMYDKEEMESEGIAPAEAESNMAEGTSEEIEATFRDSNCPVAFFMPFLNTDSAGVVSIDFTVPDFNTTWALQLVGYDKRLNTANITLEAVASKPVMVKVHSPRYIRTGDHVMLTATLFNNSGTTTSVSGRIELIDLIRGMVIDAKDFEPEEMEDAASRLIEMDWTVPQDVSSVGFRAFAESGGHRDGEQALLPVLPASSPIVESTPFLIDRNIKNIKVQLPEFKESDRITLRYCDNPAWYCLSALPDIVYPESKSITSKILALYGNATAFNLISGNVSLKKGLKTMLSDKNSEFAALKSNLEKDGNLKIADLDNTPWVNDATSETLRMNRLSSLLNDSLASETIGKLADEIRNLQSTEGGWSWCPDMQPSVFITGKLLEFFGMLQKSEAITLIPNVEGMIKDALQYVDAKTVKEYEQHHKKGESLSYLLDRLYVRSMFPNNYLSGNTDKEMSMIASKSLKDIAQDWKSWDIGEKSKAAMLLWRYGMTKDASDVLESLRQYIGETGEFNYCSLHNYTLALEAFAEIKPDDTVIDLLRQTILFGRRTQDWSRSPLTAETVNAILTSGSDWTKATANDIPAISIGGKKLAIPQTAAMTGAFTMKLSAKQASKKKLIVSHTSSSPAWGSVISQYESPIMEVRESDVPDLSIRKQIVALEVGDNGELSAKEGIILKSGMKVRVTLTINIGQDMDYVVLSDERSACLEPADQLSGIRTSDGLRFYQEIRDESTNFFFSHLPKGHHVISYDCYISHSGVFSCGIATIQSQYAPETVAHTAGQIIAVE